MTGNCHVRFGRGACGNTSLTAMVRRTPTSLRGPLAGKFREMAERHQMSLARLLQDAMLTYEKSIAAGYQPGATLQEWRAQHTQDSSGT